MTVFIAGKRFADDGTMAVIPRGAGVPAGTPNLGGWAVHPEGYAYVETAVGAVPADAVMLGGRAFTQDGAAYITQDPVEPQNDMYLGGKAYRSDGAMRVYGGPIPSNAPYLGGAVYTQEGAQILGGGTFLLDFASNGSMAPTAGGATGTFTRASTATVEDWEQIVRPVLDGEMRFQGLRRVHNVGNNLSTLTSSENLTGVGYSGHFNGTGTAPVMTAGETLQYAGKTYAATRLQFALNGGTTTNDRSGLSVNSDATKRRVLSIIVKSNTASSYVMNFRVGSLGSQQITVTPQAQRFAVTVAPDADGTAWLVLRGGMPIQNSDSCDVTATAWQLEHIDGQSNINPGEYVSIGVAAAPYHGANVDAVKYFPYETANVVQQNLLLRSEEFDNVIWAKVDTTVTANQITAPDGTLSADLCTEGSAGTAVVQQGAVLIANTTITSSIWAKRGNTDWLCLNVGTAGGAFRRWFNLATGVMGSSAAAGTGTYLAASMEASGDGWYRCSVSGIEGNGAVSVSCQSFCVTGDASTVRAANSTRYLWGAQAQPGTRASTYVATVAALVYNGIVEELKGAAFAAGVRGYLPEPLRINLCLQSQDISTTWTNALTTETVNAVTAPDGTLTADKLEEDNTLGVHSLQQVFSKAAAQLDYTGTVWLKAAERDRVQVLFVSGANGIIWVANLAAGTINAGIPFGAGFTNLGQSITEYPDGWYRLECRCNSSADVTINYRYDIGNGVSFNYTGTTGFGYYVWGSQVEQASFATSYIPTTTLAVQRNADVLTYPRDGTTTGTVFVEATPLSPDDGGATFLRYVSLNDQTGNETIDLSRSSGAARGFITDGGVTQASFNAGAWAENLTAKAAMSWRTNASNYAFAGVAQPEDTGCTIPVTTQVAVGVFTASAQPCAVIARCWVLSQDLPAELATLTA